MILRNGNQLARKEKIPLTWTTWIEIEPDDTTNATVQQLYKSTQDRATCRPPDTVRLTSLTPRVAGLIHNLNRTIHRDAKGLTAREQEIAALIVSSYNG